MKREHNNIFVSDKEIKRKMTYLDEKIKSEEF